jgi:hypothetical protein
MPLPPDDNVAFAGHNPSSDERVTQADINALAEKRALRRARNGALATCWMILLVTLLVAAAFKWIQAI